MKFHSTTNSFVSVSVLLPVMNETSSLIKTVEILKATLGDVISEIIILVAPRTSSESLAVIKDLELNSGLRTITHLQQLPYLGGALREGFLIATGSHTVMMASDLETDPYDVVHLVELARMHPQAIITASRWLESGSFSDYNLVKLVANKIFQGVFSTLYSTHLSDMTYGFRLFPTDLIRAINWNELRHPFLFETILKPLRLGVAVREIPSNWKARTEGESSNSFLRNFVYFRIGLKTRFVRSRELLKRD